MPYQLPIRIVQQNIYGRSENDCEERFRTIARKIRALRPRPDIVVFNEHWKARDFGKFACDADVLTKAMQEGGRYPHTRRHYPKAEALWESNGGNSIFSEHPIEKWRETHFVNSRPFPRSGAVMARVQIAHDRKIDVWATHLEAGVDGCDDLCRLEQNADMFAFISAVSMPDEENEPANAVIVTGDFNVGGPLSQHQREMHNANPEDERFKYKGNGGYEDIMHDADFPRDLWLEWNQYLPFGYTYDCKTNNLLKSKCTYQNRLDYMFVVTPDALISKTPTITLRRMEMTAWKTPKGLNVSDHYGLDATLLIDWKNLQSPKTKRPTFGEPAGWPGGRK